MEVVMAVEVEDAVLVKILMVVAVATVEVLLFVEIAVVVAGFAV